jgi:uncharacterized protein (DUF433 family)
MVATASLTKQYVEFRNGAYSITNTRISLDSIIYAFLNGSSPEAIVQNFPSLNLEQVYGAITFYLANRKLVDNYLKEGEEIFKKLQQSSRVKNAALYNKLELAKVSN